jgi:hypothetical protein
MISPLQLQEEREEPVFDREEAQEITIFIGLTTQGGKF